MKKILIVIFVLMFIAAVVLGLQYFQKKPPHIPEISGKIIPSEMLIPDGNSGE